MSTLTLSCAEKSDEFGAKFLHDHISAEICGLLFVYNHDGEYDNDFSQLLWKVKNDELNIPIKSRIIVFGPKDIFWLNNVQREIAYMRGGKGELPDREFCKFFYPHLVRKKNVQYTQAKAATLEMLTAPWVILSYTHPKKNNRKGFVIFYRKRGESVEEFLYLIDYLMHYQILVDDTDVFVKMLDPHSHASAFFGKAKDQYVEEYGGGAGIKDRLNEINFSHLNNLLLKFSELEIGMRNV